MRIAIRVDASSQIGSGHLMRCLTLADQLRGVGAEVAFICRDLPGAMFDLLQTREYRSAKLPLAEEGNGSQHLDAQETIGAAGRLFPDGIEWLVVDHYRLDATWERTLRGDVGKIMVIDDLANRPHDCDLLLDQNYYRDLERRYEGLVPDSCVSLLGPAYVLLRQEFADARRYLRARDGSVRRIMVFFGGSDPTNQTKKALDAIRLLSRLDIAVDVVVGTSNPHQDEIMALCQEMPNAQYHCQVDNMAELISASDLAVGAGGATTWERCMLGLPTLTMVFADNQLQTTVDLDEFGAIVFLGSADELTATELSQSIRHVLQSPELLRKLSERASHLMMGWVGAEFVVNTMKNLFNADQGPNR